jgi:hypothetical protein
VTTALALYAALVSTAAIAWQIVVWRLSRRTVLKVNLSRHTFSQEDDAGREQLVEDNIIVSVINLSEHPVRISKARLANKLMIDSPMGVEYLFAVSPDDEGAAPTVLDLSGQLARIVEARDSAEAVVPMGSLRHAGIQPWLPLQVYVLTPTGDWFSSDAIAWNTAKDTTPATAARESDLNRAPDAAPTPSQPPRRRTVQKRKASSPASPGASRPARRRSTQKRKPPPPAR